MTEKEQKKSAKSFAERWNGKGYEKGESQLFWIDLLQNVYRVNNISEFITFEGQVKLDHASFISISRLLSCRPIRLVDNVFRTSQCIPIE